MVCMVSWSVFALILVTVSGQIMVNPYQYYHPQQQIAYPLVQQAQMYPYYQQQQQQAQQAYQQQAYQQQANPYGSYYSADSFRHIDPYLVNQYQSPQSFYASSRQDLDRKVQDAADLLGVIRNNIDTMMMDARTRGDSVLQNALVRVDSATQDVLNYQRQLWMDRSTPFPQLESDWQNRITAIYDNGLMQVMRAAQFALNGANRLGHYNIYLFWMFPVLAALLTVFV